MTDRSDPKAVITEYYDRVWHRNDTDAVFELFADGYVNHAGARGTLKGPEGILTNYRNTKAAFEDGTFVVDMLLVESDRVTAYYTMTGTHTGPFMGIPATGTEIKVPGIGIYEVRDGKIQESWVVRDTYVLLKQLGAEMVAAK